MSGQTEISVFACDEPRCKLKFRSFEGLVYHTASVHAKTNPTMPARAAKCPSCNDTFLFIRGSFCRDHYFLVHKLADEVAYEVWLKNASLAAAITQDELKALARKGKQAAAASVPPARKGTRKPAPAKKQTGAKKPKDDDNLQPEPDQDADEENPSDLENAEDEEPDALLPEIDTEEVKQLLDDKIIGGRDGPGLYLNLDYDEAERYLRFGLTYRVVDSVLKELASSAPHS